MMATVMATATMITGEDDDNNGQGRQRQWARTTRTARMMTARMTVTTARMTGKEGEDDRQGQRRRQGRKQQG